MQLLSIETTPNPNSMKLNLSACSLRSQTFSKAQLEECPPDFRPLLEITGVTSVFLCDTFVTINKNALAEWKTILNSVSKVLDSQPNSQPLSAHTTVHAEKIDENQDQVAVAVQTFFNVPIQVRATNSLGQKRIALSEKFSAAAEQIQVITGADYLKERHWVDYGSRYGSLEEVAQEVVDEIVDTVDDAYLSSALKRASDYSNQDPSQRSTDDKTERLTAAMKSSDWLERLQATQELPVTTGTLALFLDALKDSSHQVRRIACAALGSSGLEDAVTPLCNVLLHDASPGVRRTAGDALSDIGDNSAQPDMCQALSDSNKLVRWRAARFLRDLGTTDALSALTAAVDDTAFEVRFEIEAAIERITENKESLLPAWRRILNG